MASPSRRAQTPTDGDLPSEAPRTPSRLTFPPRTTPKRPITPSRPSFASPTKSRIARHQPHLVKPSPQRKSAQRPSSPDRPSQDNTSYGLSQRRMDDAIRLDQQGVSPFKSAGLRRSPSPVKQHPTLQPSPFGKRDDNPVVNPFAATAAFRKSSVPVSPPIVSRTSIPEGLEDAPIVRRAALRRSPVLSQASTLLSQVTTVANTVLDTSTESNAQDGSQVITTGVTPDTMRDDSPSPQVTTQQESVSPPAVPSPQDSPKEIPIQPVSKVSPQSRGATRESQTNVQHLESDPPRFTQSHAGQAFYNNIISTTPTTNLPSATTRISAATRSTASRRVARSSFPTMVFDQEPEIEEPVLPPTPVQLGLQDPVVTTPSSGIHNTPTKRFKRLRSSQPKSSPLRTHDERPSSIGISEGSPLRNFNDMIQEAEDYARYPSRRVDEVDQDADKKRLRLQLIQEIEQLQQDVRIAEEESKRLAGLHEHQTVVNGSVVQDVVLDLLMRTVVAQASTIHNDPVPILTSISNYLPFAGRRGKSHFNATSPPATTLPGTTNVSAEDLNAHLTAFSALKYTQTTHLLSQPTTSSSMTLPPLHRQHIITASSASGIFSARIIMLVDTNLHSVLSLKVESLSPPGAWSELKEWTRKREKEKDLGGLCWGLGKWFEAARERAEVWCAFREKRADGKNPTDDRKKRQFMDAENDEDDLSNRPTSISSNLTRKQLVVNLDRQVLVIPLNMDKSQSRTQPTGTNLELLIAWKITLDPFGETEHTLAANVRTSLNWKESDRGDQKKTFEEITGLFRGLASRYGVRDAIGGVLSLLSPGDSG